MEIKTIHTTPGLTLQDFNRHYTRSNTAKGLIVDFGKQIPYTEGESLRILRKRKQYFGGLMRAMRASHRASSIAQKRGHRKAMLSEGFLRKRIQSEIRNLVCIPEYIGHEAGAIMFAKEILAEYGLTRWVG